MGGNSGQQPSITVIVPVYNEQAYIEECLSALVRQDYPSERLEIIVIDGMSTDSTRDIVEAFCRDHGHIKLVDNPKRLTAAALNVGIREASHQIIVRVDGHQIIDSDYCSHAVAAHLQSHADCVGGPQRAKGGSFWGRTISLATSSRVGVGDSTHHYSAVEGWVDDTVHCCTYPREVFDRLGLFEETWRCNEDDEFNFRLRKAGGKVYFTPHIRSYYYARSSLRAFFRQYFRFGYWKVRVFRRHPKMIKLRHFIPSLFVLGLVGSALLSLFSYPYTIPLLLLSGIYVTTLLLFSAAISRKNGWGYFPALPVALVVLHSSYGSGFLAGVIAGALRGFKDE